MHPPCIMPVTSTTHRALDAKLDWPFFDQSLAVAPEDRPAIQPMTEAASTLFWRTHVSANPIERHPMLLPQQHWLRPTREGPDWVQEFNATNSAQIDQGKVSAFLRSCFKHQGNEHVIFVEMRESSYASFCATGRAFYLATTKARFCFTLFPAPMALWRLARRVSQVRPDRCFNDARPHLWRGQPEKTPNFDKR